MPSILVRLYPEIRDSHLYQYRLANCDITIDAPLAQLAPYSIGDGVPHLAQQASRAGLRLEPGEGWSVVYDGQGWIGGGWRPVTCRSGEEGVRIHIHGAGEFLVSAAGDSIRLVEPEPEACSDLLVEALLGPALILSLALQGVWCLHASAARLGSRLAIFLGESGAGKSTLASYLHQQQRAGWQRVADDILPVAKPVLDPSESQRASPVALLRFPQLKLPHTAQFVDQSLDQMPIYAAYLVVNNSGNMGDVSLHSLTGRGAISALLGQTVAARLMPPELLEKHMEFCAWVSYSIPIRVLNYPHKHSSLPEAQDLLAGDLTG